ncbi:MAG: hypothetical protein ACYC0Z_04915, partial [Acidobacteriaceae bacterium]
LFTLGGRLVIAQTADSPHINQLLDQAKSHAVLARDDADTLHSYTMANLSWQSHATRLQSMKEHVNELGKVEQELRDAREEGSPWQQEAIDRINPLLKNLADTLTSTIDHLNKNQNRIHLPAYRDYTRANYELANETATVISDFVAYGRAKSKATSLEKKLELPTGTE